MWRMRKNCREAWDQKACRERENKRNYVFWALDGIVSKALPPIIGWRGLKMNWWSGSKTFELPSWHLNPCANILATGASWESQFFTLPFPSNQI